MTSTRTVQTKTDRGPSSAAGPQAAERKADIQLKKALQGHGFAEQEAMLQPVQARGEASGDAKGVHEAAARGTSGGGGSLPHLDTIQKSFGSHDVSGIKAHTGPEAQKATQSMGAEAYASGNDVAFKGAPDLHTAAHEAAHVVQQRSGVSLKGGVGQEGDPYEQHADKVADAVVAGKSAEGLLGEKGGGGGASVQKMVQRKAGDPQGVTGGKVTLEDFAGGKVSESDKKSARDANASNDSKTLADMAKSVKTGTARSEREMLAAIAANTMPRYVARVGPKKNFTNYKSFGRPNEFIFATEPSDLAGLGPAAAMYKVGWEKASIVQEAGNPIAICILDTKAVVPSKADASKTTQVGMGKMEWPQLKTKALGDSGFMADCAAVGITNVAACFDVWMQTPVKGDPKTSDPKLKGDCLKLRQVLNDKYGANPLYSGMGATVTEGGALGAREVMLTNNDSGFALTADNHVLVDTTPSSYSKTEAEAL
ncbi:MAG TPA: DUF4157 domain-containing protein [Myxococcota bacterium]|nr:DUF4157 domain-containing protein [Myxococcota bacterium]